MSLDPVIATALAGLITTIQTVLLMYAVYHWPAGHHDPEAEEEHHHRKEEHHERDGE